MSEIANKSYTIRGVDGNDIRVSETSEREEIVVSIQDNTKGGLCTVRLNGAQFQRLCVTRYELEIASLEVPTVSYGPHAGIIVQAAAEEPLF